MIRKHIHILLIGLLLFLLSCSSDWKSNLSSSDKGINGSLSPSFTAIENTPHATYYATSTPYPSPMPSSTIDIHYLMPSELEDQTIAEVIKVTLQEHFLEPVHGGIVFCSYVLLTTPQFNTDGSITAYIAPTCSEFYLGDFGLQRGASSGGPTVINMRSTIDGWLVDYQIPQGPERAVFPTQVAPFLYSQVALPYSNLAQNNIEQAQKYFKLRFNPTATPFVKKTSTLMPTQTSFVKLVPYTLTPTLDYNNLALTINDVKVLSGNPDNLYIFVKINDTEFNEQLTDFEKGLLFSGWHIDLYRYREDGQYQVGNALVLDHLRPVNNSYLHLSIHSGYSFLGQVSLDELTTGFGNTRNLLYQIVDDNEKIVQQDTIYLTQGLYTLFANGIDLPLVMGYPNASSVNTAAYYPQEDSPFIVVKDIDGGIHHLVYAFSFCASSGITTTDKMSEISPKLIVEITPYMENGDQYKDSYTKLSGSLSIVSGVYQVFFPVDWIETAFSTQGRYQMRVRDNDGNIYHEAFLEFLPYQD